MGNEGKEGANGPPQTPSADALLAAFAGADESERYRLLSSVLSGMADKSGAVDSGSAAEVEALSKRLQEAAEEKAALADQIATVKADLGLATSKLEAEQTRGHELQLITEEQRERMESSRKKLQEVEAQLQARNAELHKTQVENEDLLLKLQRSEAKVGDSSKTDRLEEGRKVLAAENAELSRQLEQLRADKDADITRLTEELAAARSGASGKGTFDFPALWERLAAADSALVEGHVAPTEQAAERLFESYIELVRFVDSFDQLLRPFLTKYTRDHPPVRVPWDVYAKRDGARDTVKQVLAPIGGKPVGFLRVKLRGLYRWVEAAMIGSDAALESVASELYTFAMDKEPYGAGSDPNRKVKEFLRENGPDLFLQRMRELRGSKIADVFGRGA